MLYVQELRQELEGTREELVGSPYEASLDRVIGYLQLREQFGQEDPKRYQPASRVLDIMVVRMEGGDTNLSGLGAFKTLLTQLESTATSMEFPCPICLAQHRAPYDAVPVLTLAFEEEPGDYGTVLSSFPVLTGLCEDQRVPGWYPTPGARYHRVPRNHAERINYHCEDGDLSTDMERVLGMYSERLALARYLGVASVK